MIHEFKVEVCLDAVPGLEELLAEREEQRLMVVEDKLTGRAWVTGYFGGAGEAQGAWQRLAKDLEGAWIIGEPVLRALADADWRESYKAHFKAWRFGRLNWVPVWERETFVLPPGEEVLWLDPGLAFGTGNLETTRLCCERLVAIAEDARGQVTSEPPLSILSAHHVIDAGCGSGILALSAAKLGFGEIAAFDNDPEAVRVSHENANLNGMADRVHFFVGDLTIGLAGRQAELVLANIQSDVLAKHARELLGAVAAHGSLVMSGILAREIEAVAAVFAAVAPDWRRESRVLGEWAALVFSRPS
jgi:ribosomal protein L11 methyltransferase